MIEKKLTIDDIDLYGKKVLARLDLNVPIKNGKNSDNERIVRSLPTIKKIIDDNGIAILCSHLGDPKSGMIRN
jgi:phosphoglycerate kinase